MPRSGRGGPLLGDALAVWDAIQSALPYLEDECHVTVNVAPNGSRREAYFLAAAVGFSLVQRIDVAQVLGPPPSVIMLEWDAASNAVKFTLSYRTCIPTAYVGDSEKQLQKIYLFNGPPEEVIGADWNWTGVLAAHIDVEGPITTLLLLVPGGRELLGRKPKVAKPVLRFSGRPILTRLNKCAEPNPAKAPGEIVFSPNPRPYSDNRSRGTAYELLYAALTTPQGAGLKEFPSPPAGLEFTGG